MANALVTTLNTFLNEILKVDGSRFNERPAKKIDGLINKIIVRTTLALLAISVTWTNAESIDLRLHGSNTVGEKYAPLLIDGFLKQQGFVLIDTYAGEVSVEKKIIARDPRTKRQVVVDLQSHGSSTGFKDLIAGKTDLAMSSRKIKAQELDDLNTKFPGLELAEFEHIIAYDALAIIVHPDNPVNSVTLEQLAQIYSGQVSNWQDLGGADLPIQVLARDDNSGTYDTFKSLVLKPFDGKLISTAGRFESSKALADQVLSNAGAIGFVGISHTAETKVVSIASAQGADGIVPTKYTIGTEDYPLSRKLYLYYPPQQDIALAKAFIEFATHEQGQKLASEADLISFFPTTSRPRLDTHDLSREYANLAMYGRRLSVTLRLEQAEMDAKTRRDLSRLIGYQQQNPHNRLVLAGFWDDPKMSKQSAQRMTQWIDAIKQALKAAEVEPWVVQGGFLPIENNQLEQGKALNRRVEVWVL